MRSIGIKEDTFVLTPSGYRKAGDLEVGDEVITSDYEETGIVSSVKEKGRLYSIDTKCTVRFVVSGNSEVYTMDRITGATRWVQVKELMGLTGEDAEYILLGSPLNKRSDVFPWDGIEKSDGYYMRHVKDLDTEDEAFWYLVGAYIRAGNVNRKNTRTGTKYKTTTLYLDDKRFEAIKPAIAEKMKYSSEVVLNRNKLTFSGAELALFLSAFGFQFDNRVIPAKVFSIDKSFATALLEGYLGLPFGPLVEGEILRTSAVNTSLILSLSHIIEKVTGTVPRIDTVTDNGTRKFGNREVQMNDYHAVRFDTSPYRNTKSFIEGGISWETLKGVEMSEGRDFIRLETEGDNPIIVSHLMVR